MNADSETVLYSSGTALEAGREPANAFIPQEHLPGREAEVDFGEVAIRLRGELVILETGTDSYRLAQATKQRNT